MRRKSWQIRKRREERRKKKSRFKKEPNTELMAAKIKTRGVKREVIPNPPPYIPPHESEY